MDYAVISSTFILSETPSDIVSWQISSAVTNISLWPSNPYPRDFLQESNEYNFIYGCSS